jgi:hypothetical protein
MTAPSLPAEILRSIRYRESNGLPMPHDLKTRAFKAVENLAPISAEYHDRITQALISFFDGGNMVSGRNEMKRAISDAFNDAFDLGWVDGGRDFPVDDGANGWMEARKAAEFGFAEELFQQAKELKKEDGFDYFAWATARADAYTSALQAVYNAGVMWAKKNQVLTWRLGATERHCSTCQSLADGKHRASWYIARDYIPRKPGAAMDCGGYNCDCRLEDKDGNEVTL